MDFKIGVMIEKGLKPAVKAGIGVIIGIIGAENLQKAGVHVDTEVLAGVITIFVVGFLGSARNYAKHKLGWKFL